MESSKNYLQLDLAKLVAKVFIIAYLCTFLHGNKNVTRSNSCFTELLLNLLSQCKIIIGYD